MKTQSAGTKRFTSLLGIVLILLIFISNLHAQDKYPLKIDSTGKYITEQDGTPYFTVLDTAWFLNLLPREDIDLYMQNRKEKGFNTVYMNIIHPYTSYSRSESDGTGDLDENGRLITTTLVDANGDAIRGDAYGNQPFGDMLWCRVGLGGLLPDYWNHIQYILDKAKELDMQMWMVVARAARYNYYNKDAAGIARMEAYIQQLVERFPQAEYPNIVWNLGGDKSSWDSNDLNLLKAMAKKFKTLGDGRLVSFHPGVGTTAFSVQFNDAADAAGEWLDFYQIQTSHTPLLDACYKDMTTVLAHSSGKLVINSEPLYENIGDGASAVNVRGQVYQSLLSGGSGVGYGANGVWNAGMFWEYRVGYPVSADSWRTEIDAPAAYQMAYCKNLVEAYPWYEAGPDTGDEIINADDRQVTSGTSTENSFSRAPALIADNKDWALIYFPDIGWDENRTLSVFMNKFSTSSIKEKWFDPSSGEYSEWFATYSNVGTVSFTAPGTNDEGTRDWVLVLDGRNSTPQNEVPVVNAGANQSMTFPVNSVTLAGTASDDGLPNGTLTTAWTKVSGVGTVTFANASALNTTAEFSTSGTYVLRLTASDGAQQSSDDVSIAFNSSGPDGYIWCANESQTVNFTETVDVAYGLNGTFNYLNGVTGSITFDNSTFGDPLFGVVKKGYYRISAPANQAPTANAGIDQSITLPANTVTLAGIVSDDGLPSGSLTNTWAKVSGLGTVTFADAAAVKTTAVFSSAGTYVLRLIANDSALSVSDDMLVTVVEAPVISGIEILVNSEFNGSETITSNASILEIINPQEGTVPVSVKSSSFNMPADVVTVEASVWAQGSDNMTIFLHATDWSLPTEFQTVTIDSTWQKYTVTLDVPAHIADQGFNFRVDCDGKGTLLIGKPSLTYTIDSIKSNEILSNPDFTSSTDFPDFWTHQYNELATYSLIADSSSVNPNEESFPLFWTHQYNELATYNLRNDISFEEGYSVLEIDNPQEGTTPVSIKSSSFNLAEDVVEVEASVWAQGVGEMTFYLHATDWSLPTKFQKVTIGPTWQKYTVTLNVPAHIADQGFNFRIDCDGKGEISLAHPSLQSIH